MKAARGYITRLDEPEAEDLPAVGSKVARLAGLRRAGMLVPQGYAVTTAAYRQYLEATGLGGRVRRRLDRLTDPGDPAAFRAAAEDLEGMVRTTEMPDDIAQAIRRGYEELACQLTDPNPAVAVRSSATGEDGATASFAGQYLTVLGVSGAERVVAAVKACWASLFGEQVLGYRVRAGLADEDCHMAVAVLELIVARSSGVAFSVHPVTGRPDRLVVEANWGFGEAVVQGVVEPDRAEIGKSDGRLLSYRVSDKQVVSAFDPEAGCVVECVMPGGMRKRAVLNEEELAVIGTAVVALEQYCGHAVDVEWVIPRHRRSGDPPTIVQVRPITVAATSPAVSAWDPATAFARYAYQS